MENSKGKRVFLLFIWSNVLLRCWFLPADPVGFSKKVGSNGARKAGKYKHLAVEGSSPSDLESEDELQIDETPPPARRKPAGHGKKKKLSGEKYDFKQVNRGCECLKTNVEAHAEVYIFYILLHPPIKVFAQS